MSPDTFLNNGFKFKYNPEAVTNHTAKSLYILKKNTPVVPIRLFVYPSGLCNDSCRYCSDGLHAGGGDYEAFLKCDPQRDFFRNTDLIDKLVDDIKRLKIMDVHLFGGGEPFFYKEQTFYFLEQLRNTDVFIRVITNANNLGREDIRRIVKDRLVSQLNISFNTDSRQQAERLYLDPSRHDHTLDTLGAITEYKRTYNVDFPKIDIMFILLNINYNRIADILKLLEGHEINYFMFQPLRRYSDKQEEFALTAQQQEEFSLTVPSIERRLQERSIRSNISEFKKREGGGLVDAVESTVLPASPELVNKYGVRLRCYMPLTTVSICYNGHIPFCQFRYDQQYKQNYFDLNSLEDFIKSKEYSSFIQNFIDGALPPICAGCNFCVPLELELMRQRFLAFV